VKRLDAKLAGVKELALPRLNGSFEQVWHFLALCNIVEAILMSLWNQIVLQRRSFACHADGLIRLALAPVTLLNALIQQHFGAPLIHPPCLITLITGHPCLGCGLTRAMTLLWQGHLQGAFALNPLSPIVFSLLLVLFCLQVRRLVIFQRELLTTPK
jgi:hypothetical protein